MNKDNDMLVFDEDKALQFILDFVPVELKNKITADEVDYVLDIIYEFYEKNGYIDEDSADETNIDEEDMSSFIIKCIQKDKVVDLSKDEVQIILDGEFEYGKSIGVYKEVE